MEEVMVHAAMDQSISPYKKNSKKFHRNPMVVYSRFSSTGLLQPPAPAPALFLYQSFPSYPLRQSSQPPLLPLPAAAPRRSASCSPPSKKVGGGAKKPRSPQKGDKRSPRKSRDVDVAPGFVVGGGGGGARRCESLKSVVEQLDIFSGSAVFTVSPPPSSLPLPSFSMRPKFSCTAEAAAGVDAGATDDLRRLLRLR